MKKPPRFAPGRFSVRGQRTRFKRQRGLSLAGLLIWWSGSGCGEGQSFDFGAQAALVTSCLVFVEDALVGNGVHHGLHLGKQICGFGLVTSCNGFFDVFHSGTVFGAQRRVRSVDFDVLADAFTAGGKTGVFLFRFSGCHIKVLSVSEDDVQRTRHSSRPREPLGLPEPAAWPFAARMGKTGLLQVFG
jgi:hypothetical protein